MINVRDRFKLTETGHEDLDEFVSVCFSADEMTPQHEGQMGYMLAMMITASFVCYPEDLDEAKRAAENHLARTLNGETIHRLNHVMMVIREGRKQKAMELLHELIQDLS